MGKCKFYGKIKALIPILLLISASGCYNTNSDKMFSGINIGNLAMVEEAVAEGYDINLFKHAKEKVWDNYPIKNPLLVSIFNGFDNIADYLISAGADINFIAPNGKSILYYLVEAGAEEYCIDIIKMGADVNYKFDNKSILQLALEKNEDSVIYAILDRDDIIVTKENIDTEISKINSGNYNSYGYLKALLIHNDKDVDPLIYNAVFNCEAISDENITSDNINLISGCIAAFGLSSVLDKIIENKQIDLNELYIISCKYGNLDNVKYLLSKNVNINKSNEQGITAIEIAMMNNQCDVVKFLLTMGASTRGEKGTNYDDILTFAAKNDNYEITKLLIEKYNDNLDIGKALIDAANNNNMALKAMLDAGVSPNYPIESMGNILNCVCLFGNAEGVELLISHGVNLNMIDGDPILTATQYGNKNCVDIMCANGVDINYNINNNKNRIKIF